MPSKISIFPQLLTAGQASRYLGMSRTKFWMEVNKGFIRCHSTPAKDGIPAKRKTYWIKDLDGYIKAFLAIEPAGKVYQSIGQRNASKM
jgi:hypothetical protein